MPEHKINAKRVPMEECRGELAPWGSHVGDVIDAGIDGYRLELSKFMLLDGSYQYLWIRKGTGIGPDEGESDAA